MASDNDNHEEFEDAELLSEDELMLEEESEEADIAQANAQQDELVKAAEGIEFVALPIACTNEGKGAPLAMGIQRWWAQELAQAGAKAAAPVFTALHEQEGRKVPALMVFREDWTDERALEGIKRFPNAQKALITNMQVDEDKIAFNTRFVILQDEQLNNLQTWEFTGSPVDMAAKIHEMLVDLGKHLDVPITYSSWSQAFGTDNIQALTSFLVGLGNLSALQGRCVPTTSNQLLAPLLDAINRAPEMDIAMQALHAMVDILIAGQPDQGAIPLSLQAMHAAAQKRKKDPNAWHHLAMILRRVGDLGGAVNAFQQALNLSPSNATVASHFIDTLRQAGDLENALKVAQFAVENGNEGPVVLAMLGNLLLEHDQFDEAEPFLRRAIEEGKIPSAYGDLANVLWESADEQNKGDDRKEALYLLAAAVELPRVAKSTLDMLLDLHEEEKLEDATKLLLKAADRHPEDSTVLRYVATMYMDGDNPPAARPYLESILNLKRRTLDDDAFARRGLLALSIDDFEDRYDAVIEAVRSDDPKTQLEASKFLREIIAKDALYWQPHLLLALAVRGSEGDSAALAHLLDAVRLRPNDAEIRNLLAAILRKQGRPREAVEHLRAVVAINPRDIEPVIALASCMRDANMFEEARQVCAAALKMIPNHPEFSKIMASLPPPKDRQN